MILRLRIAPHSHVFSQSLHWLHSFQRLILNTVSVDSRPSAAPSGHRNRQYRLRTNTLATSSTASMLQSTVVPSRVNIQNGSM